MFLPNAVEDSVDEFSSLLRAELLGQFNGFVERDFGRHIIEIQQFIHTQSQDVAIQYSQPLKLPAYGLFAEHPIDLGLSFLNPVEYGLDIGFLVLGVRVLKKLLKRRGDELATIQSGQEELASFTSLH